MRVIWLFRVSVIGVTRGCAVGIVYVAGIVGLVGAVGIVEMLDEFCTEKV